MKSFSVTTSLPALGDITALVTLSSGTVVVQVKNSAGTFVTTDTIYNSGAWQGKIDAESNWVISGTALVDIL